MDKQKQIEQIEKILSLFQISYDGDEIIRYFDEDDIQNGLVKALADFLFAAGYRKIPNKILANKVYSDTTLKSWTKEDLIEHIRILEHNWATAEESLNNSVKNSEKIFAEKKAEIERLKDACECFQEMIISMQGGANNKKGVMIIHEVK